MKINSNSPEVCRMYFLFRNTPFLMIMITTCMTFPKKDRQDSPCVCGISQISVLMTLPAWLICEQGHMDTSRKNPGDSRPRHLIQLSPRHISWKITWSRVEFNVASLFWLLIIYAEEFSCLLSLNIGYWVYTDGSLKWNNTTKYVNCLMLPLSTDVWRVTYQTVSINSASALTLHVNKTLSVWHQEERQDKSEGYVKKGIWCKIYPDSPWVPVWEIPA